MKTIFRSIGLGMFAAVLVAAGSTAAFAQAGCDNPEEIEALDKKIRDNYGKLATRKIAVDAGKEFLEKYGACEAPKEFADWVKTQLPKWEESIAKKDAADKMNALFTKFDGGIAASRYDDVYAAGKELLAIEPENVHVMIPMGLFGVTETAKKNLKYNDDSLRYAKLAIEKLKAGAKPKMNNGKPVLNKEGQEAFSTWDFSRQEAIDELSYAIAYITYAGKNDKKAALPMFYDLSQSAGKFKNDPRVYGAIGDFYNEEASKFRKEIPALIEKQKALPTDEEKLKMDPEIEGKIALFNGYAERAMDAYGRAHKLAPAGAYKDNLYKIIGALYKERFEKDTGINEYIAAAIAKPFPNPTSEVKPVSDPKPADATTNTSSGSPATKPGTSAVTTKP